MVTIKGKQELLQVNFQTTDYEIRQEQVRGTAYWVVPVVMMVEGVHHGSKGPLLNTEDALADSVAAWNGMPVTIGHPQNEDGKYISANLPGVLEGIVGRIYNPQMKDTKLTAEVWIDINSLKDVSEEAFEYIKEKKALEVSVGVFSVEVNRRGEFGGEEYRAEATDLIPDHLALLPGELGACSWDDGCGIRNNSKTNMNPDTSKDTKTFDKAAWLVTLLERSNQLISNESSFGDVIRNLHDQVGRTDNDLRYSYVEEVFADYFVYCTVNRASGERLLFKREYTVQEDGSVSFDGAPVKVRRDVSFVAMSKHTRTNFNKHKTKAEMKTNKCKCTVDSLIENEATNFSEDDREWLTELPQEQLDKMAPKVTKPAEPAANKSAQEAPKETAKDDSLVKKLDDGSISINGKSIDQYIKDSLAKEGDPMKFIDNFMPTGLKDQMKSGLKMYQARREQLVKGIAANSKFKAEQLKDWSDENLEALHATVVTEDEEPAGNYAPLGRTRSLEEGSESDANDEEEIGAMLSFATSKKEKPAEKK